MRDLKERHPALDRFIAQRRLIAEGMQATINSNAIELERSLSLTERVFGEYVYYTLCQYSLGCGSGDARAELNKAVEWFFKVDSSYLTTVSLDRYWRFLSFFSLMRLLESGSVLTSLVDHWRRFGIEDRLINFILHEEWNSQIPLLHEKTYAPVEELVGCSTDGECKKMLQQYLKG